VEEAGDEPYLLAKRLKNVPVIVDKDRGRGASYAVERFEVSHVLLDDAFQHRRLHRDVDIVLVSATQGFGNGWLLPAGPLRERRRELGRAHLILLTKSDLAGDLQKRRQEITRHTKSPILEARHVARSVVPLDESAALEPENLSGKRVMAVSGIADPSSFQATLQTLGARITGAVAYRDHHRYRPRDLARLNAEFLRRKAELLVTTAKDAVRWPSSPGNALPVFYLDVVMEVSDPAGLLETLVL